MYRRPGQTAVDWCVQFHDTHQGTTYSEEDLSRMIDNVRSMDREVQHLINMKWGRCSAWKALQHTVSGV